MTRITGVGCAQSIQRSQARDYFLLDRQKERFHRDGVDPWPLLASDDKAKQKIAAAVPAGTTPGDLAAWTAVARVILNLDETITKE